MAAKVAPRQGQQNCRRKASESHFTSKHKSQIRRNRENIMSHIAQVS